MAKWTNKSINSFSFFVGVLAIIVGIIMLIRILFSGGDSEAMASSLFSIGIGIGIIFVLWNLYSRSIKPPIDIYTKTKELLDGIKNNESLNKPCTIIINRKSSAVAAVLNYEMYLNGSKIGLLKNGGHLSITTNIKNNIIGCPIAQYLIQFEIQENMELKSIFKHHKNSNITVSSGANII
jgi:hypothetical protein